MTITLDRVRRKIKSTRHLYFDNFEFIHINKTGGSSVEKALNMPLEHKTALEKIEEIGYDVWNRRLTFTVIRNPWDKVVSHYHYRVKTNQTSLSKKSIGFREWLQRAYRDRDPFYYDDPKMFMPQMDWLSDSDGNLLVDEIIRFEHLNQEFSVVMKKLGKRVNLPHVKSSKRGNYKSYYDDDAVQIVQNCFEKDIDFFGYTF